VGAGGGSIAWIDPQGRLKVGPQSAGSAPGPVAYGRGGTEPTVTDANLVLGRYDPAALLGGSVQLDVIRAREAVEREIAAPLGLSVEAAAAGIVRIVNVLMTNAVRVISVERGRDARDYTLVAYGGAGPAHAAEIASQLSIPRVLIPPFPGCASAFGAVVAASRRDVLRTVGRRSDRVILADLARLEDELRRAAAGALDDEGLSADELTQETWLDIRYEGQAHDLGVLLDGRVGEASLRGAIDAFHRLHAQLYGHAFADVPVEVVNVRVKAFGRRPEPPMWWDWGGNSAPDGLEAFRPVWFEELDAAVRSAVLQRHRLAAGERVSGPAVLHQLDSTVLVPPGCTLSVLEGGSLLLELGGSSAYDRAPVGAAQVAS
jgi:N-methylhydantoinase A